MRRELWMIVLGALLVGIGAYAYYFMWDRPLLEPSDIDRYAVGYEGQNIRDFAVYRGPENQPTLDRILTLVNEATLVNEDLQRNRGDLLIVLFRSDGLQYQLSPGPDSLVGISEGDRSYLGALKSEALAGLLRGLAEQASSGPPETTP